jgi:hypothetical protein
VILRSLLTAEDRTRLVWTTLSPLQPDSDPLKVSLAPAGRRSLLRDGTIRTGALRKKVLSLLRERDAAAAWVVAHGAAVRIAPYLIAAGVPVHITVHDDPAWGNVLLTRRYVALAPLLARDLNRSLSGAQSADVVSEPMARRYGGRHGAAPVVVHRGLPNPVSPAPPYDRRQGMVVGVLGSTYGLRELGALCQALSLLSDALSIPAKLTVIGTADEMRIRDLCPRNLELEVTGHLSEPEGVAKLQMTFLLYLSYPFGRRGRVLRTTSFPTKLSTYAMAARPLILHMPSDSSVAHLDAGSPYATLWSSLTPDDGAQALVRLWQDARTFDSFHNPADQVRERYFDPFRNRTVLLQALNALVDGR